MPALTLTRRRSPDAPDECRHVLYYGPRVSFYGHDRGWHRGWYHRYGDRDVIIRRHHYWDD
jgi:hypothetical protein